VLSKIINDKILLGIITLAIIARVYIAFGTGLAWFSVDSVNYIIQAKALLSGEYLYYFPNGYPLIIAFFLTLSPLIPFKIGLIIFNIILSTLTVVLVYLISEKLFEGHRKFALIAASIAAFYPNQLNYTRFILTEVPATFFLVLSIYLLMQKRNNLAGLSIGFASAIKTTLLPVILLFMIYLLITKKIREGFRFTIFGLIPVSAFLLYGYLITGGFTLYIDVPKVFFISLGLEEVPPDFLSGLGLYLKYLITNPVEFILDRIKSLWDLWGFLPEANEGLRSNIFFRILIGLRFPLLILAVIGFIKIPKNSISIYLILPALVITLIHALVITSTNESFIANPRYIFPAEPSLIVLAVIGLKKFIYKRHPNSDI